MSTAVIIPFRLREGADPRRQANLDIVQAWWYAHGFDPQIVSDGLEGDAQFNRHRAYNRAVSRNPEAEVFIFTEADMLIHPSQIRDAVYDAGRRPGLVVPFTQYRYLSDETTAMLRDGYHDKTEEKMAAYWARAATDPFSLFGLVPESTMDGGRSIGPVNVMSRRTLDITGGFTEATSGNWYDDNITEEGFAFLTGQPTHFIEGPAVHMYHLPGHKGDHLTDEDKRATEHNKRVLYAMRRAIRYKDTREVRRIMAVRR